MSLVLKPNSVIEARLGINNGGPVHAFFTATCAKAMDKFVPFASGTMATNVKTQKTQKTHKHMSETVIQGGQPTSNVTTDTITYTTPYARYQYYGMRQDGSHKIVKRDLSMHPLATSYWDKKMWTAKGEDVIKQTQNYLNRGGK